MSLSGVKDGSSVSLSGGKDVSSVSLSGVKGLCRWWPVVAESVRYGWLLGATDYAWCSCQSVVVVVSGALLLSVIFALASVATSAIAFWNIADISLSIAKCSW